ncbi:hypothetical protein DPMN_148550 [Dreissena polymorpha]|uniref:Uncharacterized protein n=1 Tax=Dreissena polymorpha TaxID=45954 RepID=A0A9D4J1M6_DREPO|nr:hypothetical protein DPMN_148550 [Dreissena polymorpha]
MKMINDVDDNTDLFRPDNCPVWDAAKKSYLSPSSEQTEISTVKCNSCGKLIPFLALMVVAVAYTTTSS